MKVYVGLKRIPYGQAHTTAKLVLIDKSPHVVADELYALDLDGHETTMLEYDTETNRTIWLGYGRKVAFRRQHHILRPDDV